MDKALHRQAISDAGFCFLYGNSVHEAMELAIQSYLEATGMVILPRHPTTDMIEAANDEAAAKIYEAMIAAYQSPFTTKPETPDGD